MPFDKISRGIFVGLEDAKMGGMGIKKGATPCSNLC